MRSTDDCFLLQFLPSSVSVETSLCSIPGYSIVSVHRASWLYPGYEPLVHLRGKLSLSFGLKE